MIRRLALRAYVRLTDDTGATAVEYGLLVGAIALMLTTAGVAFADELGDTLGDIIP